MVQANFAFTQVYAALSLIVSQIEQITNFAAGVQRLSTFADAISPGQAPVPGIKSEEADRFALTHLTLLTPNGTRTLINDLTVDLESRTIWLSSVRAAWEKVPCSGRSPVCGRRVREL